MEYRVLGPVEVANNGDGAVAVGGPLMRRLLAVLVLHADRVVPVDRLVEAVWGDNPPAAAEATLQTYVSRLRRAFGDDHHLLNRSPGYVLVTNGDAIDIRMFEVALADGRAALAGGDEELAVALLSKGLGLWRGRALLEFADEPWAQVDARRLEEQRVVALEELAAARLAVGPANEVVADLERLVAEQPLRERPLALLMTALYRGGRHAEALRVFQDHRTLISDELGLEVSTELRLLERQILDQDPSLAKPPVGRALRGYRLIEPIRGAGRSGETWLAVQPSVGREVVVKMIPAAVANDPQFIRRFESEAQIVAGLEHPHIVPIYDYWREAGGAYIVLRYLRGGSLASTLQARRSTNDSLTIVGQVADALSEAHRHGVAHGHLDARGVLLDSTGAAYVSDFAIGDAAADRPNTIDDVRSLGLLLAEVLAAPQPFDRTIDPVGQLRRLRPELGSHVLDIIAHATNSHVGGASLTAAEVSEACHEARTAGARGRRATSAATRNPYKGLRPFVESDAADFFGRDALVGDLVDRLRGGAEFVAVIGPSGSGKSSLVRAGLLPAVRRGAIDGAASWFVTSMTPGDDPLAELAMAIGRVAIRPISDLRAVLATTGGFGRAVRGALPDDGSELLLFIDQLEEIFTVCHDEESRRVFLDGIAHAAFDVRSRLRIVTTLRADFYDRPLQHRAFAMLLDARSLTVVPPSPAELEAAIIGPAGRADVELESGLMSHLVSDLSERPAALALLQFTMTELFDQRRSGMLTIDTYREIGGVTGALAHGADMTLEALSLEQQPIARRIFCRLVVIGDGGVEGGRRMAIDQLGAGDDREVVGAVLNQFADQRLLTFDRDPITRAPTVEIAHEALITGWPRLSAWIDEDRDALRLRREVELASQHWQESGRDDSDLYRGIRLATALEWSNEHPEMVGDIDGEFLAAAAKREQQTVAATRRSERRQRQWLTFAVLTLLLVVVAACVVVVQRNNLDSQRRLAEQNATIARDQRVLADQQAAVADKQRTLADTQRTLANARRLVARSSTTPDPSLALLLAVEANVLNPSTEARIAVATTLTSRGHITPKFTPRAGDFLVDASNDGTLLLQTDVARGRVEIARPGIGGTLDLVGPGLLASTQPGIERAAFDSAARRVVTLGADGSLRVFDVTDPESPKVLSQPVVVAGEEHTNITWNSDGSLIAVGGSDGASVLRVDGDQPVLIRTIPGCDVPGCTGTSAVSFSPTEPTLLAVRSLFGSARLVDVATGATMTLGIDGARFPQGGAAAFSPDGTKVVVPMGDAGVAIFDRQTGSLVRTLSTPTDLTFWVAFDADGSRVAAGDEAGSVFIWDAVSGRRTLSVQAGLGPTYNGGFELAADQLWLDDGGSLVDLDIDSPLLVRAVPVALQDMRAVLPRRDGALFVADGIGASIVDGTSGSILHSHSGARAWALAAGPDESTVAVGREDGGVQLLDATTLSRRVDVGSVDGAINSVATRGGTQPMIAAATDRKLRIWSLVEGAAHLVFEHDFGQSTGTEPAVTFTQDGSQLVAYFGGGLDEIDLATMKLRSVPQATLTASVGGLILADPAAPNLYRAILGPAVSILDGDLAGTKMLSATGGVAVFSPDGALAVTGDSDGSIGVVDVETGSQLETLIQARFGAIWSLGFVPGTETLVTAHTGLDGTSTFAFWNLDPTFLIKKACEVAGRDLTAAEWATYLPGYTPMAICSVKPAG